MKSLLKQNRKPDQVIVVDQSRGDESRKRVEKACEELLAADRGGFALGYIHDFTIGGLAMARNQAMAIAEGNVWLFLDDDVVLEPDFLEQLLLAYERYPQAAGVSGVVTNYARPHWTFRLWRCVFARGPFHDDRQTVYWAANEGRCLEPVRVTRLGGGLMSFRAEAIRDMRFDERLTGVSDGEDVDFCARLGPDAVLLIAPLARLVHNQSPSGRECGHALRRQARADYYLYWSHWRRGWKNRLCFLWLNMGYAFAATLGSMRRAALEPWRAFLGGIEDARVVVAGRATQWRGKDLRSVE